MSVDVPEPSPETPAMTQPQQVNVTTKTPIVKTNWDEVRRRQERTDSLLRQLRDAHNRLEQMVERAAQKQK